jgi:hypothetical protein
VLSIARCRALLGPDCSFTEAQLEQLRQDLYALAEVALESSSSHKTVMLAKTQRNPELPRGAPAGPTPRKVTESFDEEYEPNERAAILEFDAGMCRAEADDKASLRSKNPLSNSIKPWM